MRLRALRPAGDPVPLPKLSTLFSAPASAPLQHIVDGSEFRSFLFGSASAALAAAVIAATRLHGTRHPEVVVPAFTCPDVVAAVHYSGALPVLADTLPGLPWMDPASLARVLTRDTVAVIHVRFLGLPSNGAALRSTLSGGGPRLIEDAAHCFPELNLRDHHADSVVLSFGRGKPLSLRIGGMLMQRACGASAVPAPHYTRDGFAQRISHLFRCAAYNIAINPMTYWFLTRFLRFPSDAVRWREVEELQGFPLHLAEILAHSLERGAPNRGALQGLIRNTLQRVPGPWSDLAREVQVRAGTRPDNLFLWRYPLLLTSEAERDRLFRLLWRQGLGPSRMYRQPLGDMPLVRDRLSVQSTPMARDFAARFLALPLHSGVNADDGKRLSASLERFCEGQAFATASSPEPGRPE